MMNPMDGILLTLLCAAVAYYIMYSFGMTGF